MAHWIRIEIPVKSFPTIFVINQLYPNLNKVFSRVLGREIIPDGEPNIEVINEKGQTAKWTEKGYQFPEDSQDQGGSGID